MPRHDYTFPPEWDSMTPEERDEWFHAERARRQAMNQNTPVSRAMQANENERQRNQTSDT